MTHCEWRDISLVRLPVVWRSNFASRSLICLSLRVSYASFGRRSGGGEDDVARPFNEFLEAEVPPGRFEELHDIRQGCMSQVRTHLAAPRNRFCQAFFPSLLFDNWVTVHPLSICALMDLVSTKLLQMGHSDKPSALRNVRVHVAGVIF